MKCKQFYPVIMVENVRKTAEFYKQNLRFVARFENDWYIHLQSAEDEKVNIGIVQWDHPTVPEEGRKKTAGILINFEVEDVDEIYEQVQSANLPVLLSLRDEDFGQRHFIMRDPNGILLDIIKPIPAKGEYVEQYINEG